MKILIKLPTKGRAIKFKKVLDIYYDNLKSSDYHFIINCDIGDETMNNHDMISHINGYENINIGFSDNKNKIEAVNNDYLLNQIDYDIILLASDDMIPQVKGYDQIIIENMIKYFPDTDGVLWFNDGFQRNRLNTLPILGEKYYKRFGYIYHPSYSSVWCDNEFMGVANILGRQRYNPDVIIKHEHPNWGYGKMDDIHVKNLDDHVSDYKNYVFRKSKNFYL